MAAFFRLFFLTTCLLIMSSMFAFAGSWNSIIENSNENPPLIIAVEKSSQSVQILEHQSPLKSIAKFECATGQVAGDKMVQGDLKTPEGIYFVTSKRTRQLDFNLYGNVAFPLDFPNPVDRIKGKTGYGIWLHGRGKKLVPLDTKGCVAFKNEDIAFIDSKISKGTPVVIANGIKFHESTKDDESKLFKDRVLKWADAWANRSDEFFETYDPESFTKSEGSSFSYFKNRKKRIFRSTPWIDVAVFNVHALAGPDYWVTWFDQYYRSGSLSASTVKRLYWQKVDGKWKIVGREFKPSKKSYSQLYSDLRKPSVLNFVEKWRTAWARADVEGYGQMYLKNARQGSRKGIGSIKKYKAKVWMTKAPALIEFTNIKVEEHPAGFKVSFKQKYSDVSGYSDYGVKRLLIRPIDGEFKILDEQWSKL